MINKLLLLALIRKFYRYCIYIVPLSLCLFIHRKVIRTLCPTDACNLPRDHQAHPLRDAEGRAVVEPDGPRRRRRPVVRGDVLRVGEAEEVARRVRRRHGGERRGGKRRGGRVAMERWVGTAAARPAAQPSIAASRRRASRRRRDEWGVATVSAVASRRRAARSAAAAAARRCGEAAR